MTASFSQKRTVLAILPERPAFLLFAPILPCISALTYLRHFSFCVVKILAQTRCICWRFRSIAHGNWFCFNSQLVSYIFVVQVVIVCDLPEIRAELMRRIKFRCIDVRLVRQKCRVICTSQYDRNNVGILVGNNSPQFFCHIVLTDTVFKGQIKLIFLAQ